MAMSSENSSEQLGMHFLKTDNHLLMQRLEDWNSVLEPEI